MALKSVKSVLPHAKGLRNEKETTKKARAHRDANTDRLPYGSTRSRLTGHKQPRQQSKTFHVPVEIGAGIILSV